MTVGDHRKGIFSVGPGASSSPTSREGSPSRAAASSQYTRPFTPSGDVNDPYAANKRQPQGKIEPRFVFTRKKGGSPGSSSVSLPKSSQDSKRHSGFFPHHHHHHHGKKDPVHDLKHDDNGTASSLHGRNASMADLKRFFKMGPHHHHNHERAERAASPSSGTSPSGSRPGIRTPPTTTSRSQV
ncbi:MAG: hypothetical protein OK454_10530, partial [Thaumarchaeota archaeon]|nr:hypothetical protein [Nitrososphaerota archaeon]